MTVSWLKRNHVDPAKVTLVEVPFPRMDAVLHGGNVDAVVAVEPFITNIVKAGIGVTLPGLSQSLKDGSATTVWVASRTRGAGAGLASASSSASRPWSQIVCTRLKTPWPTFDRIQRSSSQRCASREPILRS